MDADRALLMSLRPVFADAILRGHKTVELRRTRPNVPVGTPVLLYSASPVKALVGTATVADVEGGAPSELWRATRSMSAVTRSQFDAYFAGASRAFGIHLSEAAALRSPVPLAQLRRIGIEPPQSFRYVLRCTTSGLPIAAR